MIGTVNLKIKNNRNKYINKMENLKNRTETELVHLLVTGEQYLREEKVFATYKGPLKKVIEIIANNHSYGYDNDLSLSENMDSIELNNGQGCDYLTIVQLPLDTNPILIMQ